MLQCHWLRSWVVRRSQWRVAHVQLRLSQAPVPVWEDAAQVMQGGKWITFRLPMLQCPSVQCSSSTALLSWLPKRTRLVGSCFACVLKKVPDKLLSAVGRFQSNLLSRVEISATLCSYKFCENKQPGKEETSPHWYFYCGKGQRSLYLATHLDGRHKAPGFSLAVELLVYYFPSPSQGKTPHSETRSSWLHICTKDGCAVSAVFRAQPTDRLLSWPLWISSLSTVARASSWSVCISPFWLLANKVVFTFFFFKQSTNDYPESTVFGLLSAESLLWSKCLCFQTPSRPV